ncbi:hypothetical protein EV421DRAFT_1913810 [Armillaria borealis]|uniref:Uncharacterized protein n=1 Tax=Armillaria borealis TaxID=47425 RepID=A0AA39IU37_9AGAR|nr:hypothetical protein EV421DRAFT_1913810 [Armillaria borealis]
MTFCSLQNRLGLGVYHSSPLDDVYPSRASNETRRRVESSRWYSQSVMEDSHGVVHLVILPGIQDIKKKKSTVIQSHHSATMQVELIFTSPGPSTHFEVMAQIACAERPALVVDFSLSLCFCDHRQRKIRGSDQKPSFEHNSMYERVARQSVTDLPLHDRPRYAGDESISSRTKSDPLHYVNRPNLPEIRLSTLAETGQAELTIPVQIQCSDTGNQSVISSAPDSDLSTDDELREITLSTLTETGEAESTIPVLKQRSYTGSRAITSSLANTPCATLGVSGVLEKLNTMLGTSYTSGSVVSMGQENSAFDICMHVFNCVRLCLHEFNLHMFVGLSMHLDARYPDSQYHFNDTG